MLYPRSGALHNGNDETAKADTDYADYADPTERRNEWRLGLDNLVF